MGCTPSRSDPYGGGTGEPDTPGSVRGREGRARGDGAAAKALKLPSEFTDPLFDVVALGAAAPSSFAVACDDGRIGVYDHARAAAPTTWKAHGKSVNRLAYGARAGLLASGGRDALVKLWTVGNPQPVAEFAGHTLTVAGVDFSTGEQSLLRPPLATAWAAPCDAVLDWLVCACFWLFHRPSLCELRYSREPDCAICDRWPVSAVPPLTADCALVASGSRDTSLRVWDVGVGRESARASVQLNVVTDVKWLPAPMETVIAQVLCAFACVIVRFHVFMCVSAFACESQVLCACACVIVRFRGCVYSFVFACAERVRVSVCVARARRT